MNKKLIKIEGYELLSQKIYRTLKSQISKGFIEPGEKLYETKIAKYLNVSRTPVREALQKLAAEGFLEITPNKSMVVTKISFEDVREVLQVRGALEALAAKIAAMKITNEEILELETIFQKIETAVQNSDIVSFCKFDDEFYDLVIEICGNKWVIKMLNNLENIIHRFRVKSLNVPGRLKNSLKEHRQIMLAIKERNSEKAEKLSKEHIDNVIENLMTNVIKQSE